MASPGRIRTFTALYVALGLSAACTTEFELSERARQSCVQCSQESCSAEYAECQVDPFCDGLERCVTDCRLNGGDPPGCDEQCLGSAAMVAFVGALSGCQSQHCEKACARPCGGWAFADAGCASCMQERCCKVCSDCGVDADCRGIGVCLHDCTPGDWACYNACFTLSQESAARLFAYFTCGYTKCPQKCHYGEGWLCVGEDLVAPLPEEPITIYALFQNYYRQPISGLEAKVCLWSDEGCDNPLESGVTDAFGQLTLTLEKDPRLTFRIDLQHPEYVPAMLVTPYPLNTMFPLLYPFLLATPAEAAQMASILGVTPDPGRGGAGLYLVDCGMSPAPNLTLSTDAAGATSYFIRDGYPDVDAGYTDYTGYAGISNLPTGSPVDVQAFHQSDLGRPVLRAKLLVRPGILTLGYLWPR